MKYGLTIAICILCLCQTVLSKELGVVGQTYNISEDDFLQLIEKRYQHLKVSGEWDRKQQAWQKKMVEAADRPLAVNTVTITQVKRIYRIDPSITLSHDIVGLDGQIIARSGTTINPLAILPLHKALLFINADDPKQMEWGVKQDKQLQGKTKWILVSGSITSTVKKLHKAVYFDQGGKLVAHFKIQHVPAMLQQDGLLLKIEEAVP